MNKINKKNAEKVIDYVVKETRPRWMEWIHQSYSDLDKIFIPRGYEQGGFEASTFFNLLEKKKIGSINSLGSILNSYKGELKYTREEKGSLESPFYRDLKKGIYNDCGKKFYESVREFINIKKAKQGFMFWMKLWQMLVCCHNLRQNYQSSFKYYLKKKYCDFRNIDFINDKDFFNISPSNWEEFLKKTCPWNELYGIGANVFDYLVSDIDEFKFNKGSYKLDAANFHFFRITGISKLFDPDDRNSIIRFLKSLNLKHKYSIREINTGIYTYCSEAEKENYGFCRDKEKCKECQVNSYCEQNFK